MYEGLTYQLSVSFSEKYPYEAPTVKFETACFHPNVDTAGNICLDILKVSASPPRRTAAPALLRCCAWTAADRARRAARRTSGRPRSACEPSSCRCSRCLEVRRPVRQQPGAAANGARCRPQQRQPAEHIRRATLGRPRESVCTPSLPLPSSQSAKGGCCVCCSVQDNPAQKILGGEGNAGCRGEGLSQGRRPGISPAKSSFV